MRCNNCGYVNEGSAQRCIKCNAELGGSMQPTMNAHSFVPNGSDAFQPAATISEVTGGGYASAGTQVAESAMRRRRPEPVSQQGVSAGLASGGTIAPGAPVGGQGTINPWVRKQATGNCWLKGLDEMGAAENGLVVLCGGDSFELTRDNTNPNDHTISSHQAMLTHDADGWYIEDCSTYRTTAVIASRRIKLEEGDVVAFGSSRFVFTEHKPDAQV